MTSMMSCLTSAEAFAARIPDLRANKIAMMAKPIRIAVFDDHPLFREGVIQLLKRVDGFEIVGEGASATDAIKVAQDHTPDIILLDLCVPGGGIEAAARIARDCPFVRTLVLAASEREQDVTSALRAGARGYVLKRSWESEVVHAVHAIVRGDFYFTPNFAARLLIERSKRINKRRQRSSSVTSPSSKGNPLRLDSDDYLN
jgi:DNA-binding NarL/FixJ family response regulator